MWLLLLCLLSSAAYKHINHAALNRSLRRTGQSSCAAKYNKDMIDSSLGTTTRFSYAVEATRACMDMLCYALLTGRPAAAQ